MAYVAWNTNKENNIHHLGPFDTSDIWPRKGLSSLSSVRVENFTNRSVYFIDCNFNIIKVPNRPSPVHTGVWIKYRGQCGHPTLTHNFEIGVMQYSESELSKFLIPPGMASPLFFEKDDAVRYAHRMVDERVRAHHRCPLVMVDVPINYPHPHIYTEQYGITHTLPVRETDNISHPVLRIMDVTGDRIQSHDLPKLTTLGHELIHLGDGSYLPLATSEIDLELARNKRRDLHSDKIDQVVQGRVKELESRVAYLEDQLKKEQARHSDTSNELAIYKAKHKDELINGAVALQRESNILKLEEQNHKTERSVHDTTAAVSKSSAATASSSASLLTTSLTVGAGIAAAVAVVSPILGAAAGLLKGGLAGLSTLGCIFGFI